ncbi:MAG: ABC transporter ATP-binding protein, partial [Nitrospirota bacterium]
MELIFELKDVSYRYPQGNTGLKDVTLSIGRGERVTILGANGSGKSTLLNILDALLFPTAGCLYAFGEPITDDGIKNNRTLIDFRKRVSLIFQDSNIQLFSPTVWDDIAFGPLQMNIDSEDIFKRVDDVMVMLGIRHLKDRAPHTLSSGEKKKVAIASSLAINPDVILLDEPTSGLDPRTQVWLIELLEELHTAGKTLISATHDLSIVEDISDRVAVLAENHTIAIIGSPDEVLSNRDLLLKVNLIHEHAHRHGGVFHTHSHGHFAGHDHEH